ncbi:NAD(P)-dependent glycerol-3-phosphate dehydrogenase [Methylophilaceae bacterium]|mgnify:FL=1|nr:NAD(P)-dependent glycerol-3-phosphate dehydrogenase [Methylophilaceae bacterium]
MNVCVLGAGAWGTALAIHIAKKHNVVLWARDSSHVSGMQKSRSNPLYLGDFIFPKNLALENDLEIAIEGAEILISVVPTSGFRSVLNKIQKINKNIPIIWANKGLEKGTAKLPHEVAIDELGSLNANSERHFGVISGPSFAAELVRALPTAVTMASINEDLSSMVAKLFHHSNMRVYTSNDVIGVSVGGALKNVIAIASGISDGMGFGNNARAALITRGLTEISRFGVALGAKQETFNGLAGAGDLVLTCTGEYSRNREVGIRLAKGQDLKEILTGLGHVAEGVFTAAEVVGRSKKLGIEMPITQEVFAVIHKRKSPREAVLDLLDRSIKQEN